MNQIESKDRGYFNYLMGILMIASASLVIITATWTEIWLPLVFGCAAIIYTLLTTCTSRMSQWMQLRRQLLNNIMEGVLISISTWLFGFANYLLTPHTLLSLLKTEWNDFFTRT